VNKSARDIEVEAAAWIYRSEDPNASADTWVAREAWLAQSPRHQVIYFRMAWGWQRTKELMRARVLDAAITGVADEGRHALGSCDIRSTELVEGDLRPHSRTGMASYSHHAAIGRLPRLAGVILTAFVALLLGAIALRICTSQTPDALVVKTDVGELRHVVLADGSQVDMNMASEIHVKLTAQRREVLLIRGEALFTVTHDALRPFEVIAGGTMARDLGTQFSVRVRGDRNVDVVVVQGQVALIYPRALNEGRSSSKSGRETLLTAGDSAEIRSGRLNVKKVDSAELDRRVTWATGRSEFRGEPSEEVRLEFNGIFGFHGMLEFHGEPLPEVIEEINRYSRGKLRLADPSIAGFKFGGTVQVQDLDSFLAGLRDFGIRSDPSKENPEEVILSRAR
jgi:ferric-dicitrate binding protein FerR (iron transport regulator)